MPASDDFVYLDSMQELADWRPESASTHALNISNTPLVPRPVPRSAREKIRSLLVCHDFKGGYHPTETPQGQFAPPSSSSGTAYTPGYLHYANIFIYFSHKRVSIPPAAWINVCHRAGVKVLGTLLVEHAEGSTEASRLFERGNEGEFLFATQLIRMSETYGFDGWLLNIESSFPRASWSPGTCQRFLEELRTRTIVLWYDAVTVLNKVHYQNGVTLLNAPFLHSATALFTNYSWRAREIWSTRTMADVMGRLGDVFMGVDCYGRGTLGGGGFDVGIALKEIQRHELSAALFAPGWTWENFNGSNFHHIDEKFWAGVAQHVTQKPAGTDSFFYTSFNRGFGTGLWLCGKKISDATWVHLGAQSLLPHFCPPENAAIQWSYDGTRAYTGAWSLRLTFRPSADAGTHFSPLYTLGVSHTTDRILQYAAQTPVGLDVGLYWDLCSPMGRMERRTEPFEGRSTDGWNHGSVLTGDDDVEGFTIVEVGVYYTPTPSSPLAKVWLGKLLFTTPDGEGPLSSISSVFTRPAKTATGLAKLAWNIYPLYPEGAAEKRSKKGLWSDQTKNFAYFIVWKGDEMRGIAYACEFVPAAADMESDERWRISGVTWEGVVFEGPDSSH